MPPEGPYFPAVSVKPRRAKLTFNFGANSFLYNPTSLTEVSGAQVCICCSFPFTLKVMYSLPESISRILDNPCFFPDVCFTFASGEQSILAHRVILRYGELFVLYLLVAAQDLFVFLWNSKRNLR